MCTDRMMGKQRRGKIVVSRKQEMRVDIGEQLEGPEEVPVHCTD